MNRRTSIFSFALVAGAMLCGAPAVHATLRLDTVLGNIQQLGDGSTAVSLGHIVIAGTPMNRLIAGGSFNASCASTYTGTIPGERTLPSSTIGTYNQLYVTIPETVPTWRNMPGFENVPSGSILSCSYAWRSHAQESTYSIGSQGIGITIGGESLSTGGSVNFPMYKSGSGDDEPNRGCIH